MIITSLEALGAAMNGRLNLENKPGYTQRSGSTFSTWWNGGLRTTAYFHNMVGLLTEIIGNPTPMNVPLVPERLIPKEATPFPVTPQPWHFRQSIDYSVSLNYAVLNYAINQKEELLYGIYKMGRNSIEKGSRDNWTLTPKYSDSIVKIFERNTTVRRTPLRNAGDTMNSRYYGMIYKDPKLTDDQLAGGRKKTPCIL